MDLRKHPEKIGKVHKLLEKGRQKAEPGSAYARRIALIADYMAPLKQLGEQLAKGRQNTPEVRAYPIKAADFKLDGKLDEAFWQRVARYGLRELQTGRIPALGTSFSAVWAGKSLYFGVRCQETNTKRLNIATRKDGDMAIWDGDCVEILLETQSHSYYQLTISPSGAMVDLDRKSGINSLWSSQAKAAAHIGDGYWSLEVRIPVAAANQTELDALNGVAGRKPTPGYPWYVNVCRQRARENGTELSAFSPTGKKHFHDLMKFGKLFVR
jgi:hypothetical protein